MPGHRDDMQRRHDTEEERDYWDSVEDQARQEAAEKKAAAIDAMVEWFFTHFEDPQVETPRDSETQEFVFPWGGPFEARDVLHGQFAYENEESWIIAAADQIERDGTTQWAPTTGGDFYEHPDVEEDDLASQAIALIKEARDRLSDLGALIDELPTTPGAIGHNAPPEDIGLPPYSDEDAREAKNAIAAAEAVLGEKTPDPTKLEVFARRFDGWGTEIVKWLGRKADLAVDETIKNGIKVGIWTKAGGAFLAVAATLFELLKHLG